MTNANFASLAPRCWTSANTITCRSPCGASAANTGICSGGGGEGAFDERRNTKPASMDRKQFIETVMMVLGISKGFANAYADEFEERKIPYEKGYEIMKASVSPQMRGVMICAEKTLLYGHGDPNKIPNGILSVLKNEGYKEGGK